MVRDMVKAKDQLINIMCSLEKIFPPAFFNIMVHLVIHLPEEAIQGGPEEYRWMYPFKRYMKKLKNYVRNKAKPEGSIAKGYVTEEALTFCSHYLKGVEIRFNRHRRNEDGLNRTHEFQVFRSICKLVEIETDIEAYKKAFPNNVVEEEFPPWFDDQADLAKKQAESANERPARVELVLDKLMGHYNQQQTQAGSFSFTPPPLPTTLVLGTVSALIPNPYSNPNRYYKVMNLGSSRIPNDDEDGDDQDGNDEDGNGNNEDGNGSDESSSASDTE
ncbi:hypothetical protein Tco_0403493 [Tanacetum coccineum]